MVVELVFLRMPMTLLVNVTTYTAKQTGLLYYLNHGRYVTFILLPSSTFCARVCRTSVKLRSNVT